MSYVFLLYLVKQTMAVSWLCVNFVATSLNALVSEF